MKRKFYCDIPENSDKDVCLFASSYENAIGSAVIKNHKRIEFTVDIPDECFIKTIVIKEISKGSIK